MGGIVEQLSFVCVSKRYGACDAVRDLSLSVQRSEILCVLGASGSGKTTVLRLAAGLERPTTGEILIAGELVAGPSCHVPPEERGVGLIFQDFALFPHLTVAENVAFGLQRLARPERMRRLRAALERVGLAARLSAYPHHLSGGEQQRVALARALAPEPRLLLMDEPFSGLDPSLREAVREETVTLLKSLGTTVLLVTHDAEEAMRVADRIALLRAGRLVQVGRPLELYEAPVDREAAAFFGAVNVLRSLVHGGKAMTPLGAFDARAFAEGANVEVLLRPHALRLAQGEAGVAAQVLDVHALGAESELTLKLRDGADPEASPPLRLVARLAGKAAPQAGSTVYLAVAREAARVVPSQKEEASGMSLEDAGSEKRAT